MYDTLFLCIIALKNMKFHIYNIFGNIYINNSAHFSQKWTLFLMEDTEVMLNTLSTEYKYTRSNMPCM